MNSIGFASSIAPTAAQTRFMLRVAGPKPHLDLIKGLWRCVGQHCYGYGEAWQDAFNAWVIQIASREDFERRRQA